MRQLCGDSCTRPGLAESASGDQADWALCCVHNALANEGFVILGGPLEGTSDVLLVVRATTPDEVRSRLAEDPWAAKDLLRVTRVARWTLRLGSLE